MTLRTSSSWSCTSAPESPSSTQPTFRSSRPPPGRSTSAETDRVKAISPSLRTIAAIPESWWSAMASSAVRR